MVATTAGPVELTLRPYQDEALQRVTDAEGRGVRKQLGVAATGLGKTVVFVALARQRNARTLILVHRDELVRQAYDKVRSMWPDVDVGIVKAESDDVHAHVVIASVQTLSRNRRLARLLASHEGSGMMLRAGPFELVIVDEAHHSAADSYRSILGALRAGESEPDGPLLLGVTATPDRGDGKGLDDLFDEITFNYDILWGIRSGYLSDVRAITVKVSDLDLSQIRTRGGDYEQGAVGRAMEQSHTIDMIVKAWHKHAEGRRTLVFTPTVAVAHAVADAFRIAGVAAAAIDAGTQLDERRRLLARYSNGDLTVLANCAVLTEGYDEPRTDCIVQARPTKSRALFTQMVGRGTRKHPDKTDLLVLDVVDSGAQHSLITVPSLFGYERKLAKRLQDGTGTLTDVAQQHDDQLVAVGKMRYEDANLFRQMRGSGIAWVQVHRHPDEPKRYEVNLSSRDPSTGTFVDLGVAVLTEGLGDWLAGVIEPDGHNCDDGCTRRKHKRVLIANVDQETAQGVAEDYVRKVVQSSPLLDPDAAWRKKRPSDKARRAAQKWRLPNVEQYRTAGELSDAMNAHVARIRNKRKAKA